MLSIYGAYTKKKLSFYPLRSGFSRKLTKFKLKGPLLAWAPSKNLEETLAIFSHGHIF